MHGSRWLTMDLDGDDRTDFVLLTPTNDHTVDVDVMLPLPQGGYRRVHKSVDGLSATVNKFSQVDFMVGDVNGDGISDLTISVDGLVTIWGDPTVPAWGWIKQRHLLSGVDELMGDVTGDGFADLVYVDNALSKDKSCPGRLRVANGSESGRFTLVPLAATTGPGSGCWDIPPQVTATKAQFQLVDVNGDLKADVVGFQQSSQDKDRGASTARYFTAVSDGAGGFSTPTAHDTNQTLGTTSDSARVPGTSLNCPRPGFCRVVTFDDVYPMWQDADGDGRTDLVVLHTGTNGQAKAWTALSNGAGFGAPSDWATPFRNDALQRKTTYYPLGPNNNDPDNIYSSTPVSPARWLSADFNGDGAGDVALVSAHDSGGETQRIDRALSNRGGAWVPEPVSVRHWTGLCPASCTTSSYPDVLTASGDVNGDGRDDVMFAHQLWGGIVAGWARVDVDPTPAAPSARELLSGDVNVDGRRDLLYPTTTAEGVQVRVWQQRKDGSYARAKPVNVAVPGPGHLVQSGWLVADINCDRRSDLVNIDNAPTQVGGTVESFMTVLLADGDQSWRRGAGGRALPGGRWSVADANGDGCDDLVRVRDGLEFMPPLWVMHGGVDGSLRLRPQNVGGTVIPEATGTGSLRWQTIDADGDGRPDLVHVNGHTGAIEALLNQDGEWAQVHSTVPTQAVPPRPPKDRVPLPKPSPAGTLDPFPGWPFPGPDPGPTRDSILSTGGDEPTWHGLDVNGDGATDLSRVSVDVDGSVLIETLRGVGDGTFRPSTQRVGPERAAGGPLAGADGHNWQPTDINHDGRSDLVHVFNLGGILSVQAALSNGDGRWTLTGATPLPASKSRSMSWRVDDWSGIGRTSLVWVGGGQDGGTGSVDVTGFTSQAPFDVMTTITNGLGASTAIAYSPGTDTGPPPGTDTAASPAETATPTGCRVRGGPVGRVVTHVRTTDRPTSSSDATTTFFACPVYSAQLHRIVAWRETWSVHEAADNRPSSTEHVVRAVHNSGIVQPTLETLTDSPGVLLSRTESEYLPIGPAPHTNLLARRAVSRCAGQQACATSTTVLEPDAFGNPARITETAAGSGRQRRTIRTYTHDHTRWLHGLTHEVRIVDPAKDTQLLRATLICYDGDTSRDCSQVPPHARGLATLTRAWDNTSGTGEYAVTSRATYDDFGNQVTTTDANNNVSTVSFDLQLHQHPVKICNAVGHCSLQPPESWDRRSEAPTVIIDANGATTQYAFDPLGRPSTIKPPSGSIATTTYETDSAKGTITNTTRTAPGLGAGIWARSYSDGLGRTYLVESPSADSTRNVQTRTQYSDASARPWRTGAPRLTDPPIINEDPRPGDPSSFRAETRRLTTPNLSTHPKGDPEILGGKPL